MEEEWHRALAALEPLKGAEGSNPDFLFELGVSYGKCNRKADSIQTLSK